MRDLALHSPLLLCVVTVIFGAASSLPPVSPVEPILIRLALRLAAAEEPEPVAAVNARVRVPVRLILGGVTHPAEPSPEELKALEPLGAGVCIVRLRGVGHFPHEEAPDDVVRSLLHSRATVAVKAVGA